MQITKTCLILLPIIVYSCQKQRDLREQNISKHLLETEDDSIIKKGQAVKIYDATALNDSESLVNPPNDKYYEWNVLPNDGCLSFWGAYKYGLASITFHCSGKYEIFANIYDSASKAMIATTDTLELDVTQDTLYSAQQIKSDDILNLRPGIVKVWRDPHSSTTDPPDEVYIQMIYSTTNEYEYNSAYNYITYAPSVGPNNYSFIFSDSVKLGSYPFSNGNGFFNPVQGAIDLKGLQSGIPANLAIGWLGKTYSGKVTLIDDNQYSFEWDNSGSVKIH